MALDPEPPNRLDVSLRVSSFFGDLAQKAGLATLLRWISFPRLFSDRFFSTSLTLIKIHLVNLKSRSVASSENSLAVTSDQCCHRGEDDQVQ